MSIARNGAASPSCPRCGATFGAEATACSFYDDFGSGAPGFNREQSIALPSIAVDRSTGATRGRVYVAWNESIDFYDSIPDTATAPGHGAPVAVIASAKRLASS